MSTGSSKRFRSVSLQDHRTLLSKLSASSEELMTKQRSKTLPRHLGTKSHTVDEVSTRKKPSKKTPPPPIPSRPPIVMQYQSRSSEGSTSQFRRSQSRSPSTHSNSSTPSIPEETVAPPLSTHITPDLCTPEINEPDEVEGTSKHQRDDVFDETLPKPGLSPTTKGKRKLLSGFKNTFRRRPKSGPEEKSMTLGATGTREPIVITHRRAKTIKQEILADSLGTYVCIHNDYVYNCH